MSSAWPLVVLVFIGATSACFIAVGPSNPEPNVMVRAADAPSRLVIDPSIEDSFVIRAAGNDAHVTGWRQSLQNGFRNAFPADATSGRTLELLEADLSFAPAAGNAFGTTAVVAMIRFKARLLDRAGAEIASLAGTAQARELSFIAIGPPDQGMTANSAEAIEALYEQLSERLITRAPGSSDEPRRSLATESE